jgi:hypothetical protein
VALSAEVSALRNILSKRHPKYNKMPLMFLELEHPSPGALSALSTIEPCGLTTFLK